MNEVSIRIKELIAKEKIVEEQIEQDRLKMGELEARMKELQTDYN